MVEIKKTLTWEGGRCWRFSKIVVEQYVDPEVSSTPQWRYAVYNRQGEVMYYAEGMKAKPPKAYTMERFNTSFY